MDKYEPSILSNITLTLIDSFSALIIFSYGVAQLFSKQYTAVLYLKTKSKEFNAIKDLVKEKNIYIDHIEVPQKNFMLSSNENLFLLIFILTLYGSGFILWKLLQYLYRDIYNKEDKSIMSFANKLVKAKEDQSQTFSHPIANYSLNPLSIKNQYQPCACQNCWAAVQDPYRP